MNLRSISSPLSLRSSLPNPLLLQNPRIREDLLLGKRRRRRPSVIRSQFPLENFFQTLISSSPISLDLIAPALGLATGAALFLSYSKQVSDPDDDAIIGDWILFTSPTPFNRCVLLRCPSVSFEDGELMDGVNERLLREERHCVNLTRGRIPVRKNGGELRPGDEISYQRVCVGTDDGGVISLDWPENLDLEKEHGLDTTVLIVPGTAEGSMDRDVRLFVFDALKHGCFPIVMNPRGCARSPLTTSRLFTAADSDDICTAIQFVNRLRPWTTLMSVGWGYGANMLTKYLAGVGETTPVTAAVCIDNPFDLEEATRSVPHHIAMDQKLTSGLIEILRANKELFQGRAKGFDLAKALSATSVRDFDGAVSMVSYGFRTVEDFYSKTSTRQLVNNVKIPVLFIQSDDGTVPLFSVPRSSIAENPFTSLLLCSHPPSAINQSERSSILWCQQLAFEWLSAVELALLKGRHPLLKDVDITINPSKGLAFVNGGASERTIPSGNKSRGRYDPAQWFLSHKNANEDTFMKITQSNTVNGFLVDSLASVPKESDGAVQDKVSGHLKLGNELHEMQIGDDAGTKDGGDSPIDSEGSQVLQTAAVVMNMLDVTIPGTLDDEQKKKVLTAMGQGETLMKALQGAVPDDVRGKLTTAVTEILQSQRTSLNLDGLRRIGWIPNVTSEVKSRIQEKLKGSSTTESRYDDTHPSDQRRIGVGSDGKTQDDSAYPNSGNNSTQESNESSQEKASQASGYIEDGSEMGGKPGQPNKSEKAGDVIDEAVSENYKVSQKNGIADRHSADDQVVVNDTNDVLNNETKSVDSIVEQNMPNSSTNSDEALSDGTSTSQHQVTEKEGNAIQNNEDKPTQDIVDQNVQSSSTKPEESLPPCSSSKAPSICVTQALDALTGFDDSTQMAVNSVFGVIENMIDQFEKASNQENDDEVNNIEGQEAVNGPEKLDDSKNGSGVESDVVQPSNRPENSFHEDDAEFHEEFKDNLGESKVMYSLASSVGHSISRVKENDTAVSYLDNRNLNKVGHVQNFPLDVSMNKYWESPYAAYLHRYFSTQSPIEKSSYLASATDLFLDPEEGQWKMIDQVGNSKSAIGETGENQSIKGRDQSIQSSSRQGDMEKIIEPSYVILDNEYSTSEEYDAVDDKQDDAKKEELMCLIKKTLLDALKIEVGRRLGVPDLEELESDLVYDLEEVADTVSRAVVHYNELNLNSFSEHNGTDSVKFGTIEGEHIIRTISSAVQDASRLRKVMPVGVIVGSSLASLRTYFQVVSLHDDEKNKAIHKPGYMQENSYGQESEIKNNLSVAEKEHHAGSDSSINEDHVELEIVDSNNNGIMVGAVTAALGASALLAHHQRKAIYKHDQTMEIPSGSFNEKCFPHEGHAKLEEAMQEKNQDSLVSSLAEKAMSVAGPVVPTKSDGEVDQERLVAVLAELGQKGGILRLIGKIALLWGGIRGAMSLTDRLISFLHIAERPLFQRVFGFVCMVLVLWSPIVIPLLPTLVQSWTRKTSNGIVEYACIIGVYVAIMILVMLWGKRIRGYENPLEQYGLDLTSTSRVCDFLKGLAGGVTIVMCIHSINALLGYARLSWPLGLPSSSTGALVLLKAYGSMLLLAFRGIVTATGIAIVEELLFRSWLAEEVTADLGYYHAILLSGLAFSLVQRSLPSIPGFLLLSLALFGIKQRAHGKLTLPIGIRAGIMTTNFILQTGGFLTYWPGTPFWLASTHPWHPFEGAVGMSSCAALAILFCPQPLQKKKISRTIRE